MTVAELKSLLEGLDDNMEIRIKNEHEDETFQIEDAGGYYPDNKCYIIVFQA